MEKLCRIVAAALLIACTSSPEERLRQEFVSKFVSSVVEDSDFFREFVSPHSASLIDEARKNMTGEFEIFHREEAGAGNYEYSVRLSNGATAIVFVHEEGGTVKSVDLLNNDPPTTLR